MSQTVLNQTAWNQFLTTEPSWTGNNNTNSFLIVNDIGSRASLDLSLWAPDFTKFPPNTYWIGMYPQPNYNSSPAGSAIVVSSTDPTAFCPVSGFTQLWTCTTNDQPSNLAFYMPIPADNNYVAIGIVAGMNFNQLPIVNNTNPDLMDGTNSFPFLRCIRQDLVSSASNTTSTFVWNDQNSGAPKDMMVWQSPVSRVAVGNSFSQNYTYNQNSTTGYPDILPNNS